MSLWLRLFGHTLDRPTPDAPKPALPTPLPALPVPSNAWTLSQEGLLFIQNNEALRLKAYLDSAGIPTIGYGSIVIDGVKVQMGDTITPDKASQSLMSDAKKFVLSCRQLVKVDQKQNQIDSLVDFMYNVGSGAFAGSSLLTAINSRQPVVEDLFTRWNKVHDPDTKLLVEVAGLTARRKREFTLYTR